VRKGKAGAIIAFGDMVYRALDAVERLRADGIEVALINKSTLNLVDEDAIKEYGKLPFVLVVETQNRKTGLGSKMGTWLLERKLTPRYRLAWLIPLPLSLVRLVDGWMCIIAVIWVRQRKDGKFFSLCCYCE
jgi:transketolase C-terminal domain/subunit